MFTVAFFGDAFDVAAVAQGLKWIFREAAGLSPCAQDGTDIGPEGGAEALFGFYEAAFLLQHTELRMIHQTGLGVEFLRGEDGLHHRLDLVLHVVTLVDDVGRGRRVRMLPAIELDLVKDAEGLIWVDGTERQIVVGVAAVVEVQAAEHFLMLQPSENLLNVLRLIMVAGIDQHEGLRAGSAGEQQGHAPVGDVGVIEGRLEWFVFDQHALARSERFTSCSEALGEPADAMTDILRAWIVRSIGEP